MSASHSKLPTWPRGLMFRHVINSCSNRLEIASHLTSAGGSFMRYFLAIGVCLVALNTATGQDKVPSIAVVKTWKELQAGPAINLGDGVKVRLGLESDKLPQWSGGLLYVLTEGYTPPQEGEGELNCGPVYVDFDFDPREDVKRKKPYVKWIVGKKDWPKGTYLFVHGLAVNRLGKYQIRVSDGNEKRLAKTFIEGTKDKFHPWTPWRSTFSKQNGIALPVVGGMVPVTFVKAGEVKVGKLPTLWPDEENPVLTLRKAGDNFTLSCETKFTTSRPDFHLLARW